MSENVVTVAISVRVPHCPTPLTSELTIPLDQLTFTTAPGAMPSYEVPAAGSRYRPQEIMAGGKRLTVPASVAKLLRDLASCRGEVKIRLETFRKFEQYLPELAATLTRDPNRKVTNKRAVYRVPGDVIERIRVQ